VDILGSWQQRVRPGDPLIREHGMGSSAGNWAWFRVGAREASIGRFPLIFHDQWPVDE
jgi:pimeloyl-ACP methyl ester carboxylesterase